MIALRKKFCKNKRRDNSCKVMGIVTRVKVMVIIHGLAHNYAVAVKIACHNARLQIQLFFFSVILGYGYL